MKIQIIVAGGVVQDILTDSELGIQVEVIDADDHTMEELEELVHLPNCIY